MISAALAPANPSGADRAIAAQAARELAQALTDDRLEASQPTEEGHGQGEIVEPPTQNSTGEVAATESTREIGSVEGDGEPQAISGVSVVTPNANSEDRGQLKALAVNASRLQPQRSPAGGLFGFAATRDSRGDTVDVLA